MDIEHAEASYFRNIEEPNGARFAKEVGEIQERLLADGITDDIDIAFVKAVYEAERAFGYR